MSGFYVSLLWSLMGVRVSYLLDHLWQSTAFAVLALLLTFLFRSNPARARYWIWFAAGAKFLVPFSLLTALGRQLAWPNVQIIRKVTFSVVEMNKAYMPVIPSVRQGMFPTMRELALDVRLAWGVLFFLWFCGFAAVIFVWWQRWLAVNAAIRQSKEVGEGRLVEILHGLQEVSGIRQPIRLAISDARLEPGVFGIFRPVLLLPAGIAERLEDAQLEAIIAHELCHVRQRDNLSAAFHMALQAMFWFHPLVWWLGWRLVDERERACDEEVLRLGNPPQVYAEGILRVCKFYLESPLVCVAGVTGSNLKKRIEGIMTHRMVSPLSAGRKLLLAVLGVAAVAGPVTLWLLNPPRGRAQTPAVSASKTFEVASIKPGDPNARGAQFLFAPGGRINVKNFRVRNMIMLAFQIRDFQITGGPDWMNNDPYDISAKGDDEIIPPEQMRIMMQNLLKDRFQLVFHNDTKELPVYYLVEGKNGAKLKETSESDLPPLPPGAPRGGPGGRTQIRMGRGSIDGQAMTMDMLAEQLSNQLGRTVINKTALAKNYTVKLEWTPETGGVAAVRDGAPGGDAPATSADSGPTVFTALQEQLGLKLESGKGPVKIYVIDGLQRPSEN